MNVSASSALLAEVHQGVVDAVPHFAKGIVSLSRDDAERALASRLFENLRSLILDGLWAHGEKLPGTRILAKDAGVSRWTAVMAVDMLIAEGLVEARKRSGTYVNWSGGRLERHSVSDVPREGPPANMPFALGTAALDVFPLQVWRRIQSKSWKDIPLDALQAGHSGGWPDLRASIAAHVAATRGVKCAAGQVIVMPSAHAGILLAGEALCPTGSAVWMEDPGYSGIRAALDAAGVVAVPVPVDEEGMNVTEGRRVAPKSKIAIVSASFQFPTGVHLSAARKRALLDWSAETGSYIIEDDYGCEFRQDRTNATPIAAMVDAARVIYMNTFSTTIFPSLRLCYLIVPRPLVERFTEILRRTERYTTVPNQIVLADFIASGHFAKHLRRCREAVVERREALTLALAQDCAIYLEGNPTDCGMHLVARFRQPTDDAAVARVAREGGLIVEPLSRFYAGPVKSSGLLLGFSGFRPDLLRDATKRLAQVLAAMNERHERAAAG